MLALLLMDSKPPATVLMLSQPLTMSQLPQQGTSQFVDPEPWMPLLRQLATNPTAGGTLTQAYIEQLSNLQRRPNVVTHVVNMNDLDDALEASL